jgi:hypothetical protein
MAAASAEEVPGAAARSDRTRPPGRRRNPPWHPIALQDRRPLTLALSPAARGEGTGGRRRCGQREITPPPPATAPPPAPTP